MLWLHSPVHSSPVNAVNRKVPSLNHREVLPVSDRRNLGQQRGFSLVELLTVIAVIAILGAIVIPVISGMRQAAEQTTSASNMRQLGLAIHLYANDNHGKMPRSTHDEALVERTWVHTLAPYLEDVDDVRICPADPRAEERLEADATSYLLNEFLVVAEKRFDYSTGQMEVVSDFTNLRNLPDPARTAMVFVGAESMAVGATADHTHSRGWTTWGAVLSDIDPDRHGNRANYLFADNHIEARRADELRALIEGGENFADPGRFLAEN